MAALIETVHSMTTYKTRAFVLFFISLLVLMSHHAWIMLIFFRWMPGGSDRKNPCAGRRGGGNCCGFTLNKLFTPVIKKTTLTNNKVTVVGTGQVGMAIVFALLSQKVTNDVCMIDLSENKLKGEMLDLNHGSAFLDNPKISASKDYAASAGSKICVITAGIRQKTGETRLDLLQRNTDVLKIIVPQLMKHSPDSILLIASNPVDILSYLTWKISGLPKYRVIGSGTNLDSARFRFLLSERLGVAPTSCQGYIIGEHGDSSVPVWSSVNIAGVLLRELNPQIGTECDPEKWQELHQNVVKSGYRVRQLKGYTSWAIALSVVDICQAILTNMNSVHAVSTYVKGEQCISHEIFLSLPCLVGRCGVSDIVRQRLTTMESSLLLKSADVINNAQEGIIL